MNEIPLKFSDIREPYMVNKEKTFYENLQMFFPEDELWQLKNFIDLYNIYTYSDSIEKPTILVFSEKNWNIPLKSLNICANAITASRKFR